jgi:hypothetical protein
MAKSTTATTTIAVATTTTFRATNIRLTSILLPFNESKEQAPDFSN